MSDLSLKKQVHKNLSINIITFVINIFIGLWLVPYLVKHIGIAAYGLIPLAMFFSEYISIIIMSLNSAINRFLLIALQKKDFLQANEIFNTSLVIMMLFGLLQIIFMIILVIDLPTFVNVPEELISDARWLFSCTFAAFALSLLRAVYATPIYSYNRLDITQVINISYTLIRVIIIIFLFLVDEPLLRYVGIANLSASLFTFFYTVHASKKLVPELKINLSLFDKKRVKDLSKMGGWVLVSQVGGLLFLKVDLYIINTFIGATKAGQFAAVQQFSNLIRMMMGVISGVLTPVIMIYYANNDIAKLIKLSKIAVKAMGLFLAIPLGLLVASAGDVLSLWLGENFRNLEGIMILLLAPLIINLATSPLFAINTAYNRVKIPGIMTLILGIINILFAILLVTKTDLGIYGVILAGAILLTLKNFIFTPFYASYILEIPGMTFIKPILNGVIAFIFVIMLTYGIKVFINPDSLITLLLIFSVVTILTLPFIYFTLLSKEDRVLFYEMIPKSIKDKLPKLLKGKRNNA